MAIEDIIKTLDLETKQEEERILFEAKKKASEIEKDAKDIAVEEIEKKLTASGLELQSERSTRITKAQNQFSEMVSRVREEMVEKAFSLAEEQLAGLRKAPSYPGTLRKLFKEAFDGLPEAEICRCDPADEQIVRELAKKIGFKGDIVAGTAMIGGVILRTGDGAIQCDNSFDSRLQRSKESLKEEIAKTLFSD